LKKRQIRCDLGGGQGAQVQLFHASPNARAIVRLGFDLVSPGQTDRTVTLSSDWSAVTLDKTCQEHGSFICTKCTRQVLFCDCLLGRHLNCSHQLTSGFQFGLKKWHSVAVESDSCGALFPDILLRDCEQVSFYHFVIQSVNHSDYLLIMSIISYKSVFNFCRLCQFTWWSTNYLRSTNSQVK